MPSSAPDPISAASSQDVRWTTERGIPMDPSVPNPKPEDLRKLLADLYELLEAYGPVWYSQQLHERLVSALKADKHDASDAA